MTERKRACERRKTFVADALAAEKEVERSGKAYHGTGFGRVVFLRSRMIPRSK